jgi:hypothetical protein
MSSSPLLSVSVSGSYTKNNKAIPAASQAPPATLSPKLTAPTFHPRLRGPRPVPVGVEGESEVVVARPGDLAMLDEAERVVVVIPRGELAEFSRSLPGLKEANEGVPEASRASW